MSSRDLRRSLLDAVADQLRVGPLARRRIITELADHIDDAVEDLRGSGISGEEAVEVALERLGDPHTIADAFGASHPSPAVWSRLRIRRSLAWIAVAAMSLVTAWAAELPQASGAKPPAKVSAHAAGWRTHAGGWRAPTISRPRHGHLADRR